MAEYRYYLRGEIDIAAAPDLRIDLRGAVARKDAHLLIDCSRLTFIDSTGIAVLLEAHRALEEQGRLMLIANVPPRLRRTFDVLGLTDLLHYDIAN